MSAASAPPVDVGATIRSKEYRGLLVLSAGIGFVIALAAWCFLTLVPWIQDAVYVELPSALGFDPTPTWWPLPVLAIAGLITAYAIVRLPGSGGNVPARGLSSGGPTRPEALPGILIAALATLGLGLVLGPSSPIIAIGMGGALLILRIVKKDASEQVQNVVGSAGSFASFSLVFRNAVIPAIILIEGAGLGGPTLRIVVLPGLLGAAIGSFIYLGMGSLTGLSTDSYAVSALVLDPMGNLTLVAFGWTIVVAPITAVIGVAVVKLGLSAEHFIKKRPFVLIPVAGVVVGGLATAFDLITGEPVTAILFSGSAALDPVVAQAAILPIGTIAALILFKGLAWGVSMGSFRGGPVFPAIFLGTAGGLLAANLPGFPEGAAVAAVMGAMIATVLRLPLSAVVITMVMTNSAGPEALPLTIIAVVIANVTTEKLYAARRSSATEDTSP